MTVNDLRLGDILLYPSSNLVPGFQIAAFGVKLLGLKNEFVHCSIITTIKQDSFEECSSYTNRFLDDRPGVLITERYGLPCKVYRVPGISVLAVLEYLKSKIGTPYDWIGMAKMAFVRRMNLKNVLRMDDRKLICSELVARAIECGGVILPRRASEIIPQDFADMGFNYIGELT